MLRYFLFHEVV